MRSCTKDGRPICTIGAHIIADSEYFYTVNPDGGYGRNEVLCCEKCIRKKKNKVVRQRMIGFGAKELE